MADSLTPESLATALVGIRQRLAALDGDQKGMTDLTKMRYWRLYQQDVTLLLDAIDRGVKPKEPVKVKEEKKEMAEAKG